MTLRLRSRCYARIREHAEAGYPYEVVGILAGDADAQRVDDVATLVNERADSAHNRYQVSGLVLARAEQALEAAGHRILGYYHSHPDHPAQYSETDRDQALPNLTYLIVSVRERRIAEHLAWRLRDDRSAMDAEAVEILEDSP